MEMPIVVEFVDIILLTLMVVVAVAASRLRNLFMAVMLTGIFSLLSAAMFTLLDAVDVAFTEAAVGAGVSTVLMLGTLGLTTREEKVSSKNNVLALILVIFTGAALVYGTLDMPLLGDPSAPIHQHVAPHYIEKSGEEIGVPNIVTSVLASYRGYDTLGETTVIFAAGIGVLALIGRVRREGEDS
jgi:multicomponent Na+:H+ antiporter subunit B